MTRGAPDGTPVWYDLETFAVLDWIASHLSALNFVVLAATLAAVIAYTRAAFQQAEGLLKPCLTPGVSRGLTHWEPAPIPWGSPPGTPQVQERVYEIPELLLHNIGSGPALNIRYQLRRLGDPESPQIAQGVPGSPIAAGENFYTGKDAENLPNPLIIHMTYESLSGKKYESRGVLERRVVTELRFRRVWWVSNLRGLLNRQ